MNLALQARLTMLLAVACGMLLMLALALWLGLGRGYRLGAADGAGRQALPSIAAVEQQDFAVPELVRYAEITQRPLFSSDRRPLPLDEDGPEDDVPQEPPVPLRVHLTGVIITPGLKVALLRDEATNKPVSLKEGMPLPGEQAAWLLTEIQPRLVVFTNDRGDTSDIELQVANVTTAPPRRGAAPATTRDDAAAQRPDAAPAANATAPAGGAENAQQSLRERIEARRQQLRERAERIRQQQREQRETQ